MAYYASLNGTLRVQAAFILRGSWGAWSGDVLLAEDTAITGPVVLAIGNLTLVGAAYRGSGPEGAFAGSRAVRLVGGAGGWRTTAPRQFYADTNGVKLSTVLRDVSRLVGETVNLPTASDRVLGQFWNRAEAPASRTLALTVGEGWYIDDLGVTQIGEWPEVPVTSAFTLEDFYPAQGKALIATEDPLAWRPGTVFQGPTLDVPLTASSTRFALHPDGRLRVEVLVT